MLRPPAAPGVPCRLARPARHARSPRRRRRAPHRRRIRRVAPWSPRSVLGRAPRARPAAADGADDGRPRVLLQGHARVGSWIAIAGPPPERRPVDQRRAAAPGRHARAARATRPPVQLDSPSDKTGSCYAQPPSFGRSSRSSSSSGDDVDRPPEGRGHGPRPDAARRRRRRRGPAAASSATLDLPAVQNQQRAVVVPLDARRPARARRGLVGARPPRLAGRRRLEPDAPSSSTALRGWIAARRPPRHRRRHGAASATLGGFPDDLLPYRPTSTRRRRRRRRSAACSATLPAAATDVPAMAGELTRGRALATSGDRVIAAEATYGSGLGDAPRVRPDGRLDRRIDRRRQASGRRLIPPRSDGHGRAERRQPDRRRAVSNLPSLALPPIGGLLAAPVRLHRADRPDQLPRPAPARPARMGVGHDADPDRRVRRRARTRFGIALRGQQRDRQRGRRSSAAPRTRPRAPPRSTSASSRRRAAPTRSPCRAARSCRRRSRATSSAATGGRPRRRPGRPVPRPRPRRRVRVAADDPGRDARSSSRRSTPTCPSSTAS